MKAKITQSDDEKFVRTHGLGELDPCLCGSNNKYKHCCKPLTKKPKNKSEIKNLHYRLLNEAWQKNRRNKRNCYWFECTSDTQLCHSIQNKNFLSIISDSNKKVWFFSQNIKSNLFEIMSEKTSTASTFMGLCNHHDRALFQIIEGRNSINFSKEQLYALNYRTFLYMYHKFNISKRYALKEALKARPINYLKDKKRPTEIHWQDARKAITDWRLIERDIAELKLILLEIEKNFNENASTWNINTNFLKFSRVRTIKVANPFFCFQTAKKYLHFNEAQSLFPNNENLDIFNTTFNYISTIIIPNYNDSSITVFFAATPNTILKETLSFIDNVNSCCDQTLIHCLNNIILDSYEELYFSKDNFFDKLSELEKAQLFNALNASSKNQNSTLILENIFNQSSFPFLKL